jgi:hypothetical protein
VETEDAQEVLTRSTHEAYRIGEVTAGSGVRLV